MQTIDIHTHPFLYHVLTLLNSYDLSYKKRFRLGKEKNPYDRYSKVILEYFEGTNPIYTNYQKILDKI